MGLVKETQIGQTKVRIHDDYCRDVSEAKIKNILDRIATRALSELNASGPSLAKMEEAYQLM